MKKNNTKKFGVFYKSQGKWTPVLTEVTKQPKTFTSVNELNRFLNSWQFRFTKNYVLKSKIIVLEAK